MSEWEKHFAHARDMLVAFRDSETAWLKSLGDPRLYRSDHDSGKDSYLAVFPQVPPGLQGLLASAFRSASAGMDAVACALSTENSECVEARSFPFASSKTEFYSQFKASQGDRFKSDVWEALCDIGPYPDGDDPLYALHHLASDDSNVALVPYATVPPKDPPRAGTLTLSKEHRGKLVKEPLSADDQLEIFDAASGWDNAKQTLMMARWARRTNVHVEARVQAWIVFDYRDRVPRLIRGQPAYSTSRDLITRAARLSIDLSEYM